MKSLLALALVSLAFCSLINIDQVEYLKKNAPFEVYEPDENPFRDYTKEQLQDLFTVQLDYPEGIEIEGDVDPSVPESFDFRETWPECTGEVRNQAKCGSCWAFSGAVALQQRFCIASKGEVQVVLSPQDSVSCDKSNLGCSGGYLPRTWSYYKSSGLVTESCFPYSSQQGKVEACITECKSGEEWKKYKVSSYSSFKGVAAIKKEIMTYGPVQTGFTVYEDFMSYKSGIYVHTTGSVLGGHAVIIIGWGVEDGVEYWIAQNSWDKNWGENGYFKIKTGQCGFDSNAYAGTPIV